MHIYIWPNIFGSFFGYPESAYMQHPITALDMRPSCPICLFFLNGCRTCHAHMYDLTSQIRLRHILNDVLWMPMICAHHVQSACSPGISARHATLIYACHVIPAYISKINIQYALPICIFSIPNRIYLFQMA